MNFSPQQLVALEQVASWRMLADKPFFYLAGPAGTGKTTLAKYMTAEINGRVFFLSQTGKAALRLRQCGCPGAGTIHGMIYIPREKSTLHLMELQEELRAIGADTDRSRELRALVAKESENLRRPTFLLNTQSEIMSAALIVLDEVSMIGNITASDLLSFNVPILALGDPYQLPPVGDSGFFTKLEPDFLLTEIHRQALDSPVLRLATMAREGTPLPLGEYGESRVVPKGTLTVHELASHDQIIVGTNDTRRVINGRIRKEVKGWDSPIPVAGDTVICLRNDHMLGILNGSQWEVQANTIIDEDQMILVIRDTSIAESYPFEVVAFRHYFEGRDKEIPPYMMRDAQHFDFGYAITAHKAQGSEWKSVAVVDETHRFRDNRSQWKYTAITRASERITVIQ